MEKYLIEGNISVKAALLANKREVIEIIVDEQKKDKDTHFILKMAKQRNILITFSTKADIQTLANGSSHGGLIAWVGERYQEQLLDDDYAYTAIVEGIEDPFNFGYIARSLYASGCKAMLVNERNWSSEVTTVTKSSAGASEYIKIIACSDFDQTCSELKKRGVRIICAMRKDAIEYTEEDYNQPLCIALGGEKRGLSQAVLQHSDQNVYIPYTTDFKNALNGASAASILAFEIQRQRR